MTDEIDVSEIDRFWTMRSTQSRIEAARFHPEFTAHDLALVLPLLGAEAEVLDLGCGTCVLANALAARDGISVHAVDKYEGMLRNALPLPGLTTEVADVVGYGSDRRFDMVLLFGVINSIPNAGDRRTIYRNIAAMLKPSGVFVLKSQLGIAREVRVDRYSEELGARYVAIYPHVSMEKVALEAIFEVTSIDPYPDSFNPWPDTRHHAFVCRRH